jgi:hypothetical protein
MALEKMDRVAHLRYEVIQHELDGLRTDYRYLRKLHESALDSTRHVLDQICHLQALVESLHRTQAIAPIGITDPTAHVPFVDRPSFLDNLYVHFQPAFSQPGLHLTACCFTGENHAQWQ